MGRPKKSVPAPAEIEPDEISQEVPDQEPARVIEPEPLPKGAVSQSDAAHAALNAGYEKPAQAVEYIKAKFGIDMDPQYFSAIKTRTRGAQEPVAKKATFEKAKPGRKPKAAAPGVPTAAQAEPSPKATSNGSQPDLLTALEGVKELVGQFGADQVKRMVDLLG